MGLGSRSRQPMSALPMRRQRAHANSRLRPFVEAMNLSPAVHGDGRFQGVGHLALEPSDREATGIMTACTGIYALPLRLEVFNRAFDGLNTLLFEENAGRLTRDVERVHDIECAPSSKGDEGSSTRLRLCHADTEVFAAGKHHGSRLRERAHILTPWQIASEGDIRSGECPQLLTVVTLPNHNETARRHFAKSLYDEIHALVGCQRRGSNVIIVLVAFKLQVRHRDRGIDHARLASVDAFYTQPHIVGIRQHNVWAMCGTGVPST